MSKGGRRFEARRYIFGPAFALATCVFSSLGGRGLPFVLKADAGKPHGRGKHFGLHRESLSGRKHEETHIFRTTCFQSPFRSMGCALLVFFSLLFLF